MAVVCNENFCDRTTTFDIMSGFGLLEISNQTPFADERLSNILIPKMIKFVKIAFETFCSLILKNQTCKFNKMF